MAADNSFVALPLSFRILAVSYYRPRKWITELQRTIVLLITKMATSRLDELHEHEAAWGKWLKSPLFNGGLDQPATSPADGGSALPANEESQFLRDFIALTPGPGAELHRKMNRAHLSASALQLSSISSQSGSFCCDACSLPTRVPRRVTLAVQQQLSN
jgi:hypothetical protein